MRNELFRDGVCVEATEYDTDTNTYTRWENGVIVEGPRPFTPAEVVAMRQAPLEGTPLAATLNAVLGLWTLQQAANIAQLPPEALVKEAEAWAAAGGTP
jgi:hypothetical protein